ncbi:MAG: hypothetical protein HYY61_06990 [Deltaproteobacteria bacterium]|nr:hypothetical protein [Deltaproteobacteria bacterium]
MIGVLICTFFISYRFFLKSPSERLKNIAQKTILAIQNKDFDTLSKLVHPDKGVRFSPYTYVEIEKDIVFTIDQIKNFFQDTQKYVWGEYDGSGEPMEFTPSEYYKRFIYDQDFAKAKEIEINKVIGQGNTTNTISKVYPEASFVEYHFPGFDPKYSGMDWRSLRLVFEQKNGQWFLIGIVHDEWTI